MTDTTPVALLTIRAWTEEGSDHPLRAEIRLTKNVSTGFQSTLTVAESEKVMDTVRIFLRDVVASSATDAPVTLGSHPGHGD
jgi:hypothetical protein